MKTTKKLSGYKINLAKTDISNLLLANYFFIGEIKKGTLSSPFRCHFFGAKISSDYSPNPGLYQQSGLVPIECPSDFTQVPTLASVFETSTLKSTSHNPPWK